MMQRRTDDVGADAAQEMDRRRHGAAGREEIVEDDDALAGGDGVGLDLTVSPPYSRAYS